MNKYYIENKILLNNIFDLCLLEKGYFNEEDIEWDGYKEDRDRR